MWTAILRLASTSRQPSASSRWYVTRPSPQADDALLARLTLGPSRFRANSSPFPVRLLAPACTPACQTELVAALARHRENGVDATILQLV